MKNSLIEPESSIHSATSYRQESSLMRSFFSHSWSLRSASSLLPKKRKTSPLSVSP